MLKTEIKYEEEPMDTSEILCEGYEEEGEIHSSDDEQKTALMEEKKEEQVARSEPIFRDIPQDETQELKRLQRAKRFAIPVEQSEMVCVDSENLSLLYKSLGIDKENEKHYRFNAIHMRGTQNMSTEDVFEYFTSFTPLNIEWINDISCNVVWVDHMSAARVLLSLSKKIKNLDKIRLKADPFFKDVKVQDNEMECSLDDDDAVDAREIEAAIPPGLWRIGIPSKKSQAILLRIATRSDKKQKNAEKNSEYYKKYGNPHFGNIPGLVSNSMRNEIFGKYKKFHNNNESGGGNGKKNPWGYLAKEWSILDRTENDARSRILLKRQKPSHKEDLRLSIYSKHKKRLKRQEESDCELSQFENDDHNTGKFPKMKMYADEEENIETNSFRNKISSQVNVPVIEDLRLKIDRRKRKKEMLDKEWRYNRHWAKFNNIEEDDVYDEDNDLGEDVNDDDDDEDDEERGSSWALEQYSDLRKTLDHIKKYRHPKYSRTVDKSDSEDRDDVSDDIYNGDFSHRSPLQIEIENDEYFEKDSDNTV